MASLLPASVVVAEAYDDCAPAPLFPAEELLVAAAVPKRRAEFATGRRCAREALARLGLPPGPVLSGPSREPLWPTGVVGSITHCAGYRAAAVAHAADVAGVGIDAEPDEPLPDGVLGLVARPAERQRLLLLSRGRPDANWDRLLFCAKEAFYKAWFPLTGVPLEFDQGEVVLEAEAQAFVVTALVDEGPSGVRRLRGRYRRHAGLIQAAVVVERAR
ncbi:4'-phosphopantetheinyl transferase superfamily protein [Motilibacter sp. K478]|nr:4'-phosphopantetheinyl transferase superfamily protein [Motilibacter aurantiacus]